MARKIASWILIVLSAIFLALSLTIIAAVWLYNEPLTREASSRLEDIDIQLAQAQATLLTSQKDLNRALRLVDASQTALEKLTAQSNSAESLLENIQSTLDDRLLPELKTTRSRIDSARGTLENLQLVLSGVGGFIPGVDLSVPDKLLTDLISSARSLDTEIENVETLATQASLFVSDTSYLLGGDLTQTRDSLELFLSSIEDYQKKVTDWRTQVTELIVKTPRWVDQASIGLTIFLLWFALSQFGLFLHGLGINRGADPLLVLRRTQVDVRTDGMDYE